MHKPDELVCRECGAADVEQILNLTPRDEYDASLFPPIECDCPPGTHEHARGLPIHLCGPCALRVALFGFGASVNAAKYANDTLDALRAKARGEDAGAVDLLFQSAGITVNEGDSR